MCIVLTYMSGVCFLLPALSEEVLEQGVVLEESGLDILHHRGCQLSGETVERGGDIWDPNIRHESLQLFEVLSQGQTSFYM